MVCQTFPPTPFQVCGAILDKYNSLGGPNSFLLWPKSNELSNPGNTGARSEFVGGNIYWSSATGARPVAHDFLTKFGNYGYETGFMKYPTSDEIVLPDGIGRRQEFQGATVYWSPLSGAHTITGAIRDKWNQSPPLPAERSFLGYPISDELRLPDGIGAMNRFQNGVIYWSPSTGAHAVSGRILDVWAAGGYEKSQYGYPSGDATAVAGQPGAVLQNFQRGSIYVRADYFRGLLVPAVEFRSYDTGLHPNYPAVDLSDYDTVGDPLNQSKPANYQQSAVISAYFSSQDRPVAGELWNHYYGNTGTDFVLSASRIDTWTAETTNGYNDPSIKAPAGLVEANKADAIAQAIAEVDRTGQPAKVIVSTPWLVTAGISNDHVQALGRYSLCSTTAVIAKPGAPGLHPIDLRQTTHMFDLYDFTRGGDYGNLAQSAVDTAVTGEELGIAKPFLVLGSGSDRSWSGTK
ncbi:LGFP repeat-containing protein [Antrihabitans spumae]|uniref:LGFP repeat-containing protein n=1 Tax=Antrihabitans spumae TaxID=3373370 RepID=A0ABW7JJG0_9NOCA